MATGGGGLLQRLQVVSRTTRLSAIKESRSALSLGNPQCARGTRGAVRFRLAGASDASAFVVARRTRLRAASRHDTDGSSSRGVHRPVRGQTDIAVRRRLLSTFSYRFFLPYLPHALDPKMDGIPAHCFPLPACTYHSRPQR